MNKGTLAMVDTTENVFKNGDKLREMGLNVPIVTRVFDILKQKGINVPGDVFTVERAVEALKKINDKEDTRPELDAVKTELSDLKQSNTCLAEMFNLVFQNSTLDEETKASLTLLKNKLMSGADDVIKTLTDENAKLVEQNQALLQQLKQASTVTEITETRTRR
jgi:arginine utilization protein RocB